MLPPYRIYRHQTMNQGKTFILFNVPTRRCLNNRRELYSRRRHKAKHDMGGKTWICSSVYLSFIARNGQCQINYTNLFWYNIQTFFQITHIFTQKAHFLPFLGLYHRGFDGEGEYGDGDVVEFVDTNPTYEH